MSKKSDFLLSTVLCVLVLGLLAAGILLPDKKRSESERRTLAQFPELSIEHMMNGQWFDDLEEYLADQFPGKMF